MSEVYKANMQDKHHLLYIEDIEYIKSNKLFIEGILTLKDTESLEKLCH